VQFAERSMKYLERINRINFPRNKERLPKLQVQRIQIMSGIKKL